MAVQSRQAALSDGGGLLKFHFDQVNAQSVWLEIQNTLINVRFLLATARGYKELEPSA